METVVKNLINQVSNFGVKLIVSLIVLIIGFKIINLIERNLKKDHKFEKLDKSVKSFLVSFVTIALKLLLLVIVLSIVGVPMASLVTVIGSCAVAIGLALQGGLTNIAGGLMLLLFKPFKIGDFIEVGTYTGTVKSISMFYTTIVTPDNKNVQFPNGTLSNSDIINYSAHHTRRVDIDLPVSYNSDMEKVKKVVNEVIKNEKLIITDKESTIRLKTYDASSIVFTLRVWVETDNYWDAYFNLMENIKEAFDKNKIEIPYNQLDVHIDK